MAARVLERLRVLGPEPRGQIAQERITLAELACHNVQLHKAAALVLLPASTRARLVAGRHARQRYEGDRTTAAGSVVRICSVRSLLAKRVLELLVRQTDHEIGPDLVLHGIARARLGEKLLQRR